MAARQSPVLRTVPSTVEQLKKRFSEAAQMLVEAAEDIPAFTALPKPILCWRCPPRNVSTARLNAAPTLVSIFPQQSRHHQAGGHHAGRSERQVGLWPEDTCRPRPCIILSPTSKNRERGARRSSNSQFYKTQDIAMSINHLSHNLCFHQFREMYVYMDR